MKNRIFLGTLFVLVSLSAQAQTSGGAGNGGDIIRAGFIREGKNIVKDIFMSPNNQELIASKKITADDLNKNLSIEVIKVTNDDLTDNTKSAVDALSMPGVIFLNRAHWFEIMRIGHDSKLFNYRLLILHETLRAAAINDDNYLISTPLLSNVHTTYPDRLEQNSEWKWARERFMDDWQPRQLRGNPVLVAPFSYYSQNNPGSKLVRMIDADINCHAYMANTSEFSSSDYSLTDQNLFNLSSLKYWFDGKKQKFSTDIFYDRTLGLSSSTMVVNGKRYFIFARGSRDGTYFYGRSTTDGSKTLSFEIVTDDEANDNDRSIELPTLKALGYIECHCAGHSMDQWYSPFE